MLALQQIMPMIGEIAGANQVMKIKRLSVLPTGGDGESFARKAIATAEQVRAATGVDVADLARRLGGAPTPPKSLPSKPKGGE